MAFGVCIVYPYSRIRHGNDCDDDRRQPIGRDEDGLRDVRRKRGDERTNERPESHEHALVCEKLLDCVRMPSCWRGNERLAIFSHSRRGQVLNSLVLF